MTESNESRPARSRVVLRNISSRAWEHPADQGALVALRKLKGFDAVVKVLNGLVPELFVQASPVLNSYCVGMDRPIIVVNSALVDLLDEDELRWVLAHELGH